LLRNQWSLGAPRANAQDADFYGLRAPSSFQICAALITVGAFIVYFASSFALVARNGTTHFGGDPWLYTELARVDPFNDLGKIAYVIRVHPLTGLLGLAWMKLASPLTSWLTPEQILRALFAVFGAIGARAAISAFSAVVPRREALLWGAIYAATLGVWYFSSFEESKALTATLSTAYIAIYMQLRTSCTFSRAMLLTLVLAAACLNEIIAVFLVAIPAVDALVQRGINIRRDYWIGVHALTGPVAFLVIVLSSRLLLAPGDRQLSSDHVTMLLWYLQQNHLDLEKVYSFLVRWLLFNLAAPQTHAVSWADPSLRYGGDFDTSVANYFGSPIAACLSILALVILVCAVLPKFRRTLPKCTGALLLGLGAYAVIRGGFFLAFNPGECLLYASGVTLAHLLLVAIPFSAARMPMKQFLLLGIFVLLLATNGQFIVG
jgi:hypothetical protein